NPKDIELKFDTLQYELNALPLNTKSLIVITKKCNNLTKSILGLELTILNFDNNNINVLEIYKTAFLLELMIIKKINEDFKTYPFNFSEFKVNLLPLKDNDRTQVNLIYESEFRPLLIISELKEINGHLKDDTIKEFFQPYFYTF